MTWQEIKSNYEIGNIYNLQVENILSDHQLILFKIEGYDCRLHVSNISNERELSQKLFSVIKKGDVLSVAITDYNEEKQNINLSTKVFRTYLDDVLSFSKSKRIIEDNLKTHLNIPPKFLKQNRNILDRLRGDLSSNELTFLYELIQNAVDHPNKNFNNVSLTFEVFNNFLLVKHNGSLFTENNFESITGILAGEEFNESDKERIGYKGIGFKSIFRYTHNVYIRSGNFSFSFNKDKSGADLPWEVLPIFQLEKDKVDEIQQFEFFNVPVAFAIEFINEELKNDVIKYLKQLSLNPYLLIFLENLIRLEIKVPNNYFCLEKEIESHINFDLLTLKSNGHEEGRFLKYSKKYEIDNPIVIAELLDENITAIPSKMRHFRKPKISIALPLVEKSELINLFTYLPLSNTKHNLPYIINADFIPDLDRTDLVHNLNYNSEVLKFASEALLSFSQVLINDGRYSDFLKLIPDFENNNIRALGIIANNYIENSAILELPATDNTKIKKENLIIDKIGIFKIIDKKYINEIEKFTDKHILSSLILDEDDKLIDYLELIVFNEKDLIDVLNLDSFKKDYFSNYRQLIVFLFRIRNLENSKKIYKIINEKVKPFFISNLNYHVSDITAFIPEQYKLTFNYLELYTPCPSDLEGIIQNKVNIKSLFDLLSIDEYDEKYTVDIIAKNIKDIVKKLSINEEESIEVKANKKRNINNLWFFLFSNKEAVDNRNNKLVNNQFSDLLIECTNGELIPLKDSLLKKEDYSREDYSFLYERFGDKKMNYVNIDIICSEFKIEQKDLIKFIRQINDIEITESRLFYQTLKKLSNNEFKEVKESDQNDIVKSLISIFNYLSKIEDLDIKRDNINKFPILCSNNKIEEPSKLYFGNSYSNFIKGIDFYAENLYQNVDEINYISLKYMENTEIKKPKMFFDFLIKLKVSTGIKKWHINSEKKPFNHKLPEIEKSYSGKDDFYFINNFSVLSNKYDNLVVFWDNLKKLEDYNLLFKKVFTGLVNPNKIDSPTVIYLNDLNHNYFPLKNGKTVNINEVYSSDLDIYLKESNNELSFNLDDYPVLKDCLNFKKQLDNEDLILALKSNHEYEKTVYQKLIIDHFNNIILTQEQNETICATIKFKCFDNEFRKISDTIYLDKSLEELTISIISKSNELYKKAIDGFDYNEEFKNKLQELGIVIISKDNLTTKYTIEAENHNTTITDIKDSIVDYFNDKIIDRDVFLIEEFFNSTKMIQCSSIEILFNNYDKFIEPVLFYKDENNNELLFSDELILLDVLCEEFNINNSDKINIRKKINKKRITQNLENQSEDGVNKSKQNETKTEFSISEIETLKQIIGGELTEEIASQLEANFSASLKGILELDRLGFSPKNPEEFRSSNIKSFIDSKGNERNIIFRSAVKGLLYLDPYSWQLLNEEKVELLIYIGNDSFNVIHSKSDLLNMPYNPYTLIRIDNEKKDINLIDTLIEKAPVSSTKLLFITNQEMAEKLNLDIFNNANNQVTKNSSVGDDNYL